MTVNKLTASAPAPGIPYYTPAQNPPAGTALQPGPDVPTLFTPFKLRGMTLQNRFVVSPMCTYSADDGHLTDWHLVHLGAFALRGAALTIVEATAVTPNGRISPEDSGLWQDSQIAPLKRIVDYIHSQGQKVGIQLAHAGRKASTLGPWHVERGRSEVATAEVGGWPDDLVAPSAIAWDEGYPTPRELTAAELEDLIRSFADAARRAVEAGVDTIEIHAAHGYLLSEFLSPITNRRTDEWGGAPFENRTRLLLRVVRAVRAVIPPDMPLLVRVSATEWMEHAGGPSWDLEQTTRLASVLADEEVDLLDVSSAGNNPAQRIEISPYFQIDMAAHIRDALRREGKAGKLAIGAVGMVDNAEMARDVVQEAGDRTKADLVLVARHFLREPAFVLKAAAELGVPVAGPAQYHRAPVRKDARLTTLPTTTSD